jgi:hypothetical protein
MLLRLIMLMIGGCRERQFRSFRGRSVAGGLRRTRVNMQNDARPFSRTCRRITA